MSWDAHTRDRMRILCAVHLPDVIWKILDCLKLPSCPPSIAFATRDPYQDESNFS